MNTTRSTRPVRAALTRTGGLTIAAGLLVVTLAACNQPPAVNPWIDDAIPDDTWSTPSSDGILAAGRQPVIRHRTDSQKLSLPNVRDGVAHYPLWWEDPFEDQGDQDGHFAWTWQDYTAMPYSFGRLLINTMFWPVSAVVTLPGSTMVSDGRVPVDPSDRQFDIEGLPHPHDAYPGHSSNPAANASDFTNSPTPEPPSADKPPA